MIPMKVTVSVCKGMKVEALVITKSNRHQSTLRTLGTQAP
jgi:hypothetical protein